MLFRKLFNCAIIGYSLVFFLSSCQKNNCREDEGGISSETEIRIIRIEDSLSLMKDPVFTRQFLLRHPLFSEHYLKWSRLPHDSILVSDICRIAESPFNDTLRMDVKREFPDLSGLKSDITSFFDHVRFFYRDVNNPAIYTITAGYGNDLEVQDSVIVIGLEYFLSDSSHFSPRDPVSGMAIPAYIRRRLKKQNIVPAIAMVVADRFCKTDLLDNSMLGEMMKWGKIYYFMEKTMPCLPDSLLAGYSADELSDIGENLPTIWAHFAEKQLFFSNDLFLIRKYCDERPNVVEISDKCPGRIGRWLGWQIVRKWAIDGKIPLQKVMQETNSRKIFSESAFRP